MIVYSADRLQIDIPGSAENRLPATDSAYKVRYSGLRLLESTGGHYCLVTDAWNPQSGTVIMLADNSAAHRIRASTWPVAGPVHVEEICGLARVGVRRWPLNADIRNGPSKCAALPECLAGRRTLLASLAIYLIIQLALDQPSQQEDNGAQSPASNEFKEEAPWRLVIRNDGSSNGCTLTLVNSDTRETWTNPYAVHDTASFLIPQGGTFRWSVESGCTVVSRPGPGSLTLPAVVDGVGTSDAFEPPAVITVRVKDFHGNQRCALELRDVVGGTVVDIGELNKQQQSVTLQPQGRKLVYLNNDACAVEVSLG